jgi:glycerol-1-phosphate dehydrogenase [NAD(P)+]
LNLDSAPANWTSLIDDIREGRWISPLNGKKYPPAPYDQIIMEESLRGKEANLVKSLGFQPPFAIVSDSNTHNAMGARVARALS